LKELTPSSVDARADPGIVFVKFGLRSERLWRGASVEPAHAGQSDAARFRSALEELGGLFASFGQFLCWRADLLGADYLGRLRHIKFSPAPIARDDAAAILSAELADAGAALASSLHSEPCWNTLARCAWRSEYQGRQVAVQIARDPIPDAAFDAFEKAVRLIEAERLVEAVRPATLAAFRQWMRVSDSHARERSYLEALQAAGESGLVQYPVLIGELSATRVICTEWVEGETVASRVAQGDSQAVRRVAECVLEQICTIAAIDADFDPDSMVITPAGRLAMRRANRLVAIPAPLTQSCLKYIAAVLASNAPAAAQSLVRLSSGRPSLHLETRLLDELSNLEPELKVNLQFPPSAAIFEGNWRALRRSGEEIPLFLDAMHRNLLAVGYWNAEATGPIGAAEDAISEAQWPVLSRMLRMRLGDMMNRESASDWFLGSGLLFFELMRQMNRLAEGLRENDVSMGVELEQQKDGGAGHRRIRLGVFIGMLLIAFLGCLRFAMSAPAGWSAALSAAAVACAFSLFWLISRFD
jgi:hypothetical protein